MMTPLLSLNVLLDAGEDVVAVVVRKIWYTVFSRRRRVQIEKLVEFSKVVRMRRACFSCIFMRRLSLAKHDPEKAQGARQRRITFLRCLEPHLPQLGVACAPAENAIFCRN